MLESIPALPWLAWTIIGVALVFDFVNGFHDAANSVATVVSTRVLKPHWAVAWAAFFNFVAFLIFNTAVAATVKEVVDPQFHTLPLITAGLVGAILWDVLTWWLGLPTSSSHALIAGLAGAGVAAVGWNAVKWGKVTKALYFIPLAPLLGMLVGFALMVLVSWMFRKSTPRKVSSTFKVAQLFSAAAYSLGHGGNDAQKTMGVVIAIVGLAGHPVVDDKHAPLWIALACHLAIGLGTMSGGWRIVKTMGQKIADLQPVHGFCAETGGAICLYGATAAGIPVSTTHTITGAIVGVGTTRGPKYVRWGMAGRVIWAWILTIPASGLAAAGTYELFTLLGWR
jgi:inorganic phosphate transporter, PiT family